MNRGNSSKWILTALILVQGCASAHIVSQRDPAVAPDHYQALLVDAELSNLPESQQAELQLTRSLLGRGYLAHAEEELFFPQREYGDSAVVAILDAHGIDAVLVLRVRDEGYESQYLPHKVVSRTDVEEDHDSVEVTTTTEESGGYDVARPWASYVAELRDRESGQMVWYAELESEGAFGWGHDYEDLAAAAANRLSAKLAEDRILRHQPSQAAAEEPASTEGDKPLRLRRRYF